ncbi:MAG TPA: VanZ family protein [Spirosoma sp.]|nr:VanZ family protein [Spirosoma sp.]
MNLSRINQTKLLYYAAISWTVAIFIGCSMPGDGLPYEVSNRDKLIHIGIFLIFGFLWRWLGYRVIIVLLSGAIYGFLIEVWQGVMPINRSYDLYDALADTVGTLLGIGLADLMKIVISRKSH